jgi:PAS domain S-box-containing protein
MDAQRQHPWSMEARTSGGLLRGLASVSMPQFLKVVLPLTVVFLIAFVLEYRAQVGADRVQLLTQETSVIERGVRRVARELEIATGDLYLVADLVAELVDAQAPERLGALERSLLALVRRRPGYLQVRFIGEAGQEIVRVENAPGGPRITLEGELQDRSERSYFTDTMRLEPGDVFVSRMDLNVDRGVLEKPYKPVVRLATPVDDTAGQRRGIVVLNAHGGRFLREFERSTSATGPQRMIVDSDGYWLRHRPEVEWGFVLDHGRSFRRTFPDVWPQLVASPRGRIESSEGLFYFGAVPLQPAASHTGADAGEPHFWMFISLIPRKILDEVAVRAATPLLVTATPMYFALLAIGWLLAGALQRRRLADEALRGIEDVRSAMMRAALDAIIVMDETGRALEFNPSAQRIFGYTLEEARGRLVADLIIPAAYRERHRLGLEHYLATGEGRIIDKHVYEITGIRKGGEEFPVELTVCPVMVGGRWFFYGFLRDLSESGRREVEADD